MVGYKKNGQDDNSFNPLGNRSHTSDEWYSTDAHNLFISESSVLRGYRFEVDEGGHPEVMALENEILNADSALNQVSSDGANRYRNPKNLLSLKRNNYGGEDMVAFFDQVEAATGNKTGMMIAIYHNINERPSMELQAESIEDAKSLMSISPNIELVGEDTVGKKVLIRLSPEDVMKDPLHCYTTLHDSKGVNVTHRIKNPESCEWLVIDLTGLVSEEAVIISKSAAKSSTSVPLATSSFPFTGTSCTADDGGLEGCGTISIDRDGGVTVETAPGITTLGGETPVEEEAAPSPQWNVSGGGCSLAKGPLAKKPWHYSFLFLLSLLYALRRLRTSFKTRLRG